MISGCWIMVLFLRRVLFKFYLLFLSFIIYLFQFGGMSPVLLFMLAATPSVKPVGEPLSFLLTDPEGRVLTGQLESSIQPGKAWADLCQASLWAPHSSLQRDILLVGVQVGPGQHTLVLKFLKHFYDSWQIATAMGPGCHISASGTSKARRPPHHLATKGIHDLVSRHHPFGWSAANVQDICLFTAPPGIGVLWGGSLGG